MIGAPSILRLTRKTVVLPRVLPTLLLSCSRNSVRRNAKSPPLVDFAGCTPEAAKKRSIVVYYESLQRALKTKTIYGYRCDERLKTNVEESTRLTCTPLCAELEHLKIETRLTSETSVSEMGEYASVM